MLDEVLLAVAPHPDVAAHLAVFEPLIGSWDLVVHNIAEDGTAMVTDAEWHFGWALNGRALTDVWISPRRSTGATGEWGMSLRFYDPRIGAFRSTWHGPARGWVIPFVGKPTADGFAMEGEAGGTVYRWVFANLTATRFDWHAEETAPGAETRVRQRFQARRVSP